MPVEELKKVELECMWQSSYVHYILRMTENVKINEEYGFCIENYMVSSPKGK